MERRLTQPGTQGAGGYSNQFALRRRAPEPELKAGIGAGAGAGLECSLSWFGSSKMRRDSDMAQAILRSAAGPEGEAEPGSLPLLLWARLVGGPYCCLGVVRCARCVEAPPRPALEFDLRLLQLDAPLHPDPDPDPAGAAPASIFREILAENLAPGLDLLESEPDR